MVVSSFVPGHLVVNDVSLKKQRNAFPSQSALQQVRMNYPQDNGMRLFYLGRAIGLREKSFHHHKTNSLQSSVNLKVSKHCELRKKFANISELKKKIKKQKGTLKWFAMISGFWSYAPTVRDFQTVCKS